MAIHKRTLTLIIILIVALGVLGIKYYKSLQVKNVDSNVERTTGPANAKVSIVEFIDFECPACAYGFDVLKKYLAKYPNQIRIAVKYFPLVSVHRHAIQSALYNECAARQGKFWVVIDQMMSSQKQWSELISADGMFNDMAKQAGLEMTTLQACLVSDDAKQALEDDKMLGQSMGVQSTPTYFINNKMVVGGKALMEELAQYFPGGV